jgi:hypothetical protein
MPNPFFPSDDYKSLHLSWISNHPNFLPQGQNVTTRGVLYSETMQHLYLEPLVTNYMAYCFFENDKQWLLDLVRHSNPITDVNNELGWFITVGFNHQTWNVKNCVKVIEKILELGWISTCTGRFELHRENGLHPHVHFYLFTHDKMYKSKILEKIWAVRGIKGVCLSKSFIDVKQAQPHHAKYIDLDKVQSKMRFVDLDKIWRAENNIPEKFEKLLNLEI